MPTRFTVVCDDELAREVELLAREFDLTEEEVLRQLIDLGMDEVDEEAAA
jgi:predicted transcriptional regulator